MPFVMKKHFTFSLLFAALLSFLGGYMELTSLKHFGVFCAMETGNTIYSIIRLIDGEYMAGLKNAISVVSFVVFCLLGGLLRSKWRFKKIDFHLFALLMMALGIAMALAFSFIENKEAEIYLVNSSLAFYGATQVLAFVSFNDHPYVSTMMTVLLKNLSSGIAKAISTKEKENWLVVLEYLSIFLSFVLGAAISALSIHFCSLSPWASLLAALSFVIVVLCPLKIFGSKEAKASSIPQEQ